MAKHQIIIGRSERVDLVGIALSVPAKIDTGAFRSAVHAQNIKIIEKDGKRTLKCKLLGHPCLPIARDFETSEFNKVLITNSFGHQEERFEVYLKVKLGAKIFKTSFTLADRSKNIFPILVGRTMLKNRFFVNVANSNVDRMKLRKEFGVKAPVDAEDLE